MPVSYEKPDQALISEFFAGRGSGFRHPIGKENEPVSRGKLDLVLLVIPTREHAEHGAPFPQAGVRAVSSQENGGIMSGIGVQQLPVAGIVETIEKVMNRFAEMLLHITRFTFTAMSLGCIHSEAKALTAACRLDIKRAAGIPFPATSAMHRAMLLWLNRTMSK